ncbi:MAG TPA: hypothetical protein P5217_04720 [Methanoregulaceae archaeon]|nr:hypothetical protein [Methanoregulaceae archaeon]HPD74508.1 hypothetical protein [Methanoregulaceae archaeon]HRY75566.1 hypothetical protein [Methanoregulaceae archaeon]
MNGNGGEAGGQGGSGSEQKGGGQKGLTTTHLTIIAIAAILVIVAAVLISFGKGSTTQPPVTVPGTGTTTQVVTGQRTIDPSKIVVPTTITVSKTGIYVRVQYMGAYTGFYEADGSVHKIWTSGDRLFTVENSSQIINVSVQKTDRSAKQPLTVEIWKDGRMLRNSSTTALFGQVNLSATV